MFKLAVGLVVAVAGVAAMAAESAGQTLVYTGSIDNAGDRDEFRFCAVGGDAIAAALASPKPGDPAPLGADVVLLDESGAPLASFTHTWRAPRTGLYSARIVPGGAGGDYRLSILLNGGGESVAARGEVQANTKDIAFLKMRRGALAETRPPLHQRAWFKALLFVPLVLVPVGIVLGRRRERFLTDHGFARARRAARTAARRLARAAQRAAESPVAFHQEVAGALVDYVADRANRSAAGLTYDQLDDILAAKGVPAEPRRRYRACLETCDFARFVPDSGQPAKVAELVVEARTILRALEDVA
jgi:hypothetical protein